MNVDSEQIHKMSNFPITYKLILFTIFTTIKTEKPLYNTINLSVSQTSIIITFADHKIIVELAKTTKKPKLAPKKIRIQIYSQEDEKDRQL